MRRDQVSSYKYAVRLPYVWLVGVKKVIKENDVGDWLRTAKVDCVLLTPYFATADLMHPKTHYIYIDPKQQGFYCTFLFKRKRDRFTFILKFF